MYCAKYFGCKINLRLIRDNSPLVCLRSRTPSPSAHALSFLEMGKADAAKLKKASPSFEQRSFFIYVCKLYANKETISVMITKVKTAKPRVLTNSNMRFNFVRSSILEPSLSPSAFSLSFYTNKPGKRFQGVVLFCEIFPLFIRLPVCSIRYNCQTTSIPTSRQMLHGNQGMASCLEMS